MGAIPRPEQWRGRGGRRGELDLRTVSRLRSFKIFRGVKQQSEDNQKQITEDEGTGAHKVVAFQSVNRGEIGPKLFLGQAIDFDEGDAGGAALAGNNRGVSARG